MVEPIDDLLKADFARQEHRPPSSSGRPKPLSQTTSPSDASRGDALLNDHGA